MAYKGKVLKLVGAEVDKHLSQDMLLLDNDIFQVQQLKALTISSSSKLLPSSFPPVWLSLASCLEELDLSSCSLVECPIGIFQCTGLRSLSLRENKLTLVPSNISSLTLLISLNLEGNLLTDLPCSLKMCAKLSTLQCARNCFTQIPVVVSRLSSLRDAVFAYNRIQEIDSELCLEGEGINRLFLLDVSHNLLTFIPNEMAEGKFKTLRLNGNPFEDKQLKKLTDTEGGASVKAILTKARGGKSKRANKEEIRHDETLMKNANETKKQQQEEKLSLNRLSEFVSLLPISTSVLVQADDNVASLRPFVVCVIVRSIRLPSFKFVLDLQNKLHRELGGTRAVAAIGVHDLSKLGSGALTYEALDSSACRLQPLRQDVELSAVEIVQNFLSNPLYASYAAMLCESDAKTVLPKVCCLKDSKGQVLSLPPLINGAPTAISPDTTDLFVEVSSASSLSACKNMMGAFLGRLASHLQSENVIKTMVIEPVQVKTSSPLPNTSVGSKKKDVPKLTRSFVVTTFPNNIEDYDSIQEAADES